MSTFTAQILVGRSHPNHGGILPSLVTMFLSENSRPCWHCSLVDKKVFWIPQKPQTILEDGLLMAAIWVLQLADIIEMAADHPAIASESRLELDRFDDVNLLSKLREKFLTHEYAPDFPPKLVISVFEESSLLDQMHILANYKFDCEVLVTKYSRLHSQWSAKPNLPTITGEIS